MIAGGMESMSNVPYYMSRGQTPYGKVELKVCHKIGYFGFTIICGIPIFMELVGKGQPQI